MPPKPIDFIFGLPQDAEAAQAALDKWTLEVSRATIDLLNTSINPAQVGAMLCDCGAVAAMGVEHFIKSVDLLPGFETLPKADKRVAQMGGDWEGFKKLIRHRFAKISGAPKNPLDVLKAIFGEGPLPPGVAVMGVKPDGSVEMLGHNASEDCGDPNCEIHGKDGVLNRHGHGDDTSNKVALAGTKEAEELLQRFLALPAPKKEDMN